MKVIKIQSGQCGICSKPVGQSNSTTFKGITVHVGCMVRIVGAN